MTSPGDRMLDCYATLGVSPYDDTETIDQTYRHMVWKHVHSADKSEEATAKFQKVCMGWDLFHLQVQHQNR